jgi:hypothetical protein
MERKHVCLKQIVTRIGEMYEGVCTECGRVARWGKRTNLISRNDGMLQVQSEEIEFHIVKEGRNLNA